MKEPETTNEQVPKGKKLNLLIIIIASILVVLLGAGAGVFFFLSPDFPNAENEELASEQVVMTPIYFDMEQPFLFNITESKRERLVQINVTLISYGIANDELARYHAPLIKDILLLTFSAATIEQLRTPDGRIQLRQQATSDVRAALNTAIGNPVIDSVLFTDFVIQ